MYTTNDGLMECAGCDYRIDHDEMKDRIKELEEENEKLHDLIDRSLSRIGKSLEFSKGYKIDDKKYVSKDHIEQDLFDLRLDQRKYPNKQP